MHVASTTESINTACGIYHRRCLLLSPRDVASTLEGVYYRVSPLHVASTTQGVYYRVSTLHVASTTKGVYYWVSPLHVASTTGVYYSITTACGIYHTRCLLLRVTYITENITVRELYHTRYHDMRTLTQSLQWCELYHKRYHFVWNLPQNDILNYKQGKTEEKKWVHIYPSK